jgi:uncharacterized membrane protein YccC
MKLEATTWRRGIRAAVVVTAFFVVGEQVFHSSTVAIFGSFGAMAHLVFGDYGGLPARRRLTYLTTSGVGAVYIAVATLLSGHVATAVVGSLIGVFLISYAGALGDVWMAVTRPLTLAWVLAVAVPGDAGDIPARVVSWVAAGLVSLLAVRLLPRPIADSPTRRAAAEACRTLAAACKPDASGGERAAARQAVAHAREVANAPRSNENDALSVARTTALLVEDIGLLGVLLDDWLAAPPDGPCPDAEDALMVATSDVLAASAKVLAGEPASVPLERLDRARLDERLALEAWVTTEVDKGQSAQEIRDGLDATRPARAQSYSVLAIGARATRLTGGRLPTRWVDQAPAVAAAEDLGAWWRPALAAARRNFSPASVRFRASARLAAGIAGAILLVGVLNLSHGFWAALATFSVLRSNALGTGRAVTSALAGTIGGFVVAAILLTVVGSHDLVYWLAVPLIVFVAAVAQDAFGFAVSQGAFTVFVVIVFDLILPEGVRIGEARIEDVALGCAVAAVVGLVAWPLGARRCLRKSLGEGYTAAGGAIARRHDLVPRHTWLARSRDAFAEFQQERSQKTPPLSVWVSLLAALHLVGPLLERLDRAPAEGVPVIDGEARGVGSVFRDVGRRLLGDAAPDRAPPAPPDTPVVTHMAAHASSDSVLSTVWAADTLADLAHVGRGVAASADAVARAT